MADPHPGDTDPMGDPYPTNTYPMRNPYPGHTNNVRDPGPSDTYPSESITGPRAWNPCAAVLAPVVTCLITVVCRLRTLVITLILLLRTLVITLILLLSTLAITLILLLRTLVVTLVLLLGTPVVAFISLFPALPLMKLNPLSFILPWPITVFHSSYLLCRQQVAEFVYRSLKFFAGEQKTNPLAGPRRNESNRHTQHS